MLKEFRTKPKFINIKEANKIIFEIMFFWDYELNNKTKDSLLERMILINSCKYKTNQEFMIRKDELFIIQYSAMINYYANKTCLTISFTIPKEKLIYNYSIQDCLEFIYDGIFNVYAVNGKFDEEVLNHEKRFTYEMMKNYPSNIYDIMHKERNDAINSIEKVHLTREEVLKNLDNISAENLYKYYEKNVKNNKYITYIYGNLEDKDKISSLYNKCFKQKNQKLLLNIDYYRPLKIDKYEQKIINVENEQSILKLIYQFKKLNSENMFLLEMLYFFLNSRENDLVLNTLRNKYHIVYEASASMNTNGILEIDAYLDKKDVLKAKELINEIFDDIKIEVNFDKYKKRLLKALKYDIYFERDSIYYIAKKTISREIVIYSNLEKKYDLIRKVSYEEMKDFIDSSILAREILMIGEKNV